MPTLVTTDEAQAESLLSAEMEAALSQVPDAITPEPQAEASTELDVEAVVQEMKVPLFELDSDGRCPQLEKFHAFVYGHVHAGEVVEEGLLANRLGEHWRLSDNQVKKLGAAGCGLANAVIARGNFLLAWCLRRLLPMIPDVVQPAAEYALHSGVVLTPRVAVTWKKAHERNKEQG